ncbi:MAG: hypothetical protein IJ088_14440 [Clostridia bacterium]|nr:hypothetical protein [Clostridia bacterium]
MSFETMYACADLILTDAIEDLARDSNKPKEEIRKALMTSEAYEGLYDLELGFWQDGQAYFIDFYKRLEGLK